MQNNNEVIRVIPEEWPVREEDLTAWGYQGEVTINILPTNTGYECFLEEVSEEELSTLQHEVASYLAMTHPEWTCSVNADVYPYLAWKNEPLVLG